MLRRCSDISKNVFYKEVCCTQKIGKGTMQNIVYTAMILLYFCALYITSYFIVSFSTLDLNYTSSLASHIMETHFIGHVLSLFIPRLRLINYYMELSLSKVVRTTSAEEFNFQNCSSNKALCNMKRLMNLYHTMIKAYTYLMEAIKWQVMYLGQTKF